MTPPPPQTETPELNNRREFLNRAGKVAVVAPAAALLLAATSVPSSAAPTS